MVVHDQTSADRHRPPRRLHRVDEGQRARHLSCWPVQYGGGDQAKSADIAKSIISANPDLKGFYGANEGSAIGVVKGVEESGKKGLTIIGSTPAREIDAITSGVMAGAITQNPVGMGKELVSSAMKAIKGESVPKGSTGFYWYNKTNLDDPKIKAVLYQ